MPSIALVVLRQVCVMALLIAIGWLLARRGVLTPAGSTQMGAVLTDWVIPAVIFQAFLTLPADWQGLRLLGQTLALAAFGYVVSLGAALLLFHKKTHLDAVRRACTVFTNNGFFGIPVMQALFGSMGAFYASITVLCNNLLLWTWGVAQFPGGGPVRPGRVLRQPAALAAMAGLVAFGVRLALGGAALPAAVTGALQPFRAAVEALAALNTPLAMLVTGVNVCAAGWRPGRDILPALPLAALRQVLLPAALLGLTFWLPLPKQMIFSVYTAAACPMALLISVLAQRGGADEAARQYATRTVVTGTLLALISVPVMVALGALVVPV